jgi:hypothetical protein
VDLSTGCLEPSDEEGALCPEATWAISISVAMYTTFTYCS